MLGYYNLFRIEAGPYALQNYHHRLIKVFNLIVRKWKVFKSADLWEASQLTKVIMIKDESLQARKTFNTLSGAVIRHMELV